MQLAVTAGYDELFGRTGSWNEIESRLSLYPLSQILEVAALFSASLDNSENLHEAQKAILMGLGGNAASRFDKAVTEWMNRQYAGDRKPDAVVLFHHEQLLSLLKIAFLTQPIRKGVWVDNLVPLIEALLMVTDVLQHEEEGLHLHPAHDGAISADDWQLFFVSNGLFNRRSIPVNELARSHDLYLKARPALREHPFAMELPSRVTKATGLDPHSLWAALFALTARFISIDPRRPETWVLSIKKEGYFSGLDISEEENEAFFALATTPADNMKRSVLAEYEQGHLQRYHVVPFARYPLVEIDGTVYCTSTRLLFEKLTAGLHHLFLDQGRFTNVERQEFLNYMGLAFEDYGEAALRRGTGAKRSVGTLIPRARLEATVEGRVCDAAITYGSGDVVLLEFKAGLLPLAARTGASWDSLEAKFEDIIYDAAEQLDAAVNALKTGRLATAAPPSVPGRMIYPVVVTLETVPMNQMLYRAIWHEVAKRRLLVQEDVARLQVWEVGELELLENAMRMRINLADLLRNKLSGDQAAGLSMKDYCIYTSQHFLKKGGNFFLKARYENLKEDTLRYMRSRAGKNWR